MGVLANRQRPVYVKYLIKFWLSKHKHFSFSLTESFCFRYRQLIAERKARAKPKVNEKLKFCWLESFGVKENILTIAPDEKTQREM